MAISAARRLTRAPPPHRGSQGEGRAGTEGGSTRSFGVPVFNHLGLDKPPQAEWAKNFNSVWSDLRLRPRHLRSLAHTRAHSRAHARAPTSAHCAGTHASTHHARTCAPTRACTFTLARTAPTRADSPTQCARARARKQPGAGRRTWRRAASGDGTSSDAPVRGWAGRLVLLPPPSPPQAQGRLRSSFPGQALWGRRLTRSQEGPPAEWSRCARC